METGKHNRSIARRLLIVLIITTLVLLGLHLLLQFVNLNVYHQQHGQFYELSNRFDFDDEASVPTWFSQFLYLLIAMGAGLAAYLETNRTRRRIWTLIAVVSLIFSIDEIGALHEFVLQTLHVIFFADAAPGAFSNAWLLVLPLIVIAAGLFIGSMVRHFPRRTLLLFTSAVVIFLIGAVGVDMVTSVLERESFANQGILVGIEEMLELLSLVVIVYAVADYLERWHGETVRRALAQLKT